MLDSDTLYAISVMDTELPGRGFVGLIVDDDGDCRYATATTLVALQSEVGVSVFEGKFVGAIMSDLRKLYSDIQVLPLVVGKSLTTSEVDELEKFYLSDTLDDHQKKLLASMHSK